MSRAVRTALVASALLVLGALAANGAGWYRTHDFYAIYSGSRLVAAGLDPYDEVVWCAETENASPEAFDASRDIAVCFMRYAYPFWTALLLLPLGILSLPVAATVWIALSLALVIMALRWSWLAAKGDPGWAGLYVTIVVFSQPFVLLLTLGQMSGVLFAVTAFTAYALGRGGDRSAGGVLAFAALKPNVLALHAAALVVWSILMRRRALAVAGLVTGGALLALSLAARPAWPAGWLGELFGRQIGYAGQYATGWGLAAVDLRNIALAPVLIAAVIVAVVGIARERLRDPVVLSTVAAPISLFATPYAWSYDYLVLALPWASVLAAAARSEPSRRRALVVALLLVAIVAPWGLWVAATPRRTESLTALVPAATALLAAYAARISAPRRGPAPEPPASRPT